MSSETLTSLEAAVPTLTVERLCAARRGSATVIDLRSPAEFVADRVPGAVNVPLFDDVQRALIGTLYKQESPEVAFREGRRIVRERIHGLVSEIARHAAWSVEAHDLEQRVERMTSGGMAGMSAELTSAPCAEPPDDPLVLHCWRGGLRSRSVVAFVRALGLKRAVALEGGYKSWRRYAIETLEAWQAPPAFVLRGLTGVGKTLVLRAIEERRPGWTIDLEGLAAHRSSLLGMVGLAPVSQRRFESALAERVASLSQAPAGPVVFEGESRKVGDVTVPLGVWRALQDGVDVELVAPPARRAEVLARDYLATEARRDELRERLPVVEARMKKAVPAGTLVELLDRGAVEELVGLLLERYYDPLYRHSERRHLETHGGAGAARYARTIDSSDPEAAADAVVAWIEARLAAGAPSFS